MLLRLSLAAALAAVSTTACAQDLGNITPPHATAQKAPSFSVGFETAQLADGTPVAVWYPAQAETPQHDMQFGLYTQHVAPGAPAVAGRYPLVVISHGSGGDFAEHLDTAATLVQQGFVVASLTHPGDNWRDQSGAANVTARPRALSSLISFMLDQWHGKALIDPARIGAFGFSSGGFTVLAAHCAQHPAFYACQVVRDRGTAAVQPWSDAHDPRIKAIVVAAPALGFTYAGGGLAGVTVPVQLWHAASDRIVPAPFYAHAVRDALPTPPEFQEVPGAGHFDFIAPCTDPQSVPQICSSAEGFDRAAFHRTFNEQLSRFLTQHL
jgi:predicted dienelactone hydrolase